MKNRMLRMKTNENALAVVLGLMLLSNNVYSVCLDRERCAYTGDMSLVSVKDCITPLFECDSTCRQVHDTVALHRIRGPTTYGIEIPQDQEMRSIYQIGNFTLTYCIVRRLKNANGSLARVEHVPGCCPVNDDESCELPPRKDKYESFSVVLPFNWDLAETPFCVHDIPEKNPRYEMGVDGKVQETKDFDDKNSNIRSSNEDYDICAFGASSDLVSKYASINAGQKIFVTIQGSDKVVESGGDFSVVLPNGSYIPCEIKRKENGNVLNELVVNSTYQGEYQCMVIVGPNNNGTVTTYLNATCSKSKGPRNYYEIVVVSVVSAFVLVILIVIAVIYLYRKQLNEFCYKNALKNLPENLKANNLDEFSLGEKLLHEDATGNIDAMRLTESDIEHTNSRYKDECETDKFGENRHSDSGIGSPVDSEGRSLDQKLAITTDCDAIHNSNKDHDSIIYVAASRQNCSGSYVSRASPTSPSHFINPSGDDDVGQKEDPLAYVTEAAFFSSRDGDSDKDYNPMAYVTAPHQNRSGRDVTRASPTSLSPFINPSGDDDVEQEADPLAYVTVEAFSPDYVSEIFCGDPTEQDDLHDCESPQQTTSRSVESSAVGDYVLHI